MGIGFDISIQKFGFRLCGFNKNMKYSMIMDLSGRIRLMFKAFLKYELSSIDIITQCVCGSE